MDELTMLRWALRREAMLNARLMLNEMLKAIE
jgi:hypothetical protein